MTSRESPDPPPDLDYEIDIAHPTVRANNTGPPDGQSYQYFKIGPYRDKLHLWSAPAAALHLRNIRRGAWDLGEQFQREALVI